MTDLVLAESVWEDVGPDVEALLDGWHANPGELVEAGQLLVSVVLIKSTLEIRAPSTGSISEIIVPTEATFKRGQVLGRFVPSE